MKRVSRVLLIALIMLSLFLYKNQKKETKKVENKGFHHIKKIFPEVKKVEIKSDEYGYNRVLDASDNLLGYVVKTAPYSDEYRGYAGKVPVILGFDKDKKIIKVDLLEHSESAGFIKFIRKTGFFEKWNGKSAKEALETKVDTVSRATMTTSAVVKGINKRLGLMFKKHEKKEEVKEDKNYVKDILAFLVLVFALISYFNPSKFSKMRILLLAISVVVLGFINGQFLSSVLFYSWLINGVSFKMYYFLIIVAVIAIVIPIFTKKAFYCIYMCPYGAFQELVGKLTKKKIKLSQGTTEFLTNLRPKILTGLVILLFLNVSFDLTYIEPFSAFLIKSASMSVIVLAILFLILSLFIAKPWCRYFCPTGQFLDSFHKINAKEKDMKFSDVLNVLLAVLIAIILINPEGVKKMTAASKSTTSSNSTLKVIHSRKSVRNYTDKKVEKEKIQELLKAGMAAPTAANKQPWKFVAIQDRKILNELADSLQWGKMLKNASAAIAVCGVPAKGLPGIEAEFWIQDCSAASENILLAAEAQGLGAVWLGIYPVKERVENISKILGLDEGTIPLNVISIGYPKGTEKPKNKFNKNNVIWK